MTVAIVQAMTKELRRRGVNRLEGEIESWKLKAES